MRKLVLSLAAVAALGFASAPSMAAVIHHHHHVVVVDHHHHHRGKTVIIKH